MRSQIVKNNQIFYLNKFCPDISKMLHGQFQGNSKLSSDESNQKMTTSSNFPIRRSLLNISDSVENFQFRLPSKPPAGTIQESLNIQELHSIPTQKNHAKIYFKVFCHYFFLQIGLKFYFPGTLTLHS